MTDEKLNECCASTHGIFIKGLMCLMHKSEAYGKILLKQNYKQNKSMSLNFALQLAKHLPYTSDEINNAIQELIQEGVCYYEGDYLCQKRMIEDNRISLLRSTSGKKGVNAKANKQAPTTKFAIAKPQANSEYENEDENEIIDKVEVKKKKLTFIPTFSGMDEFWIHQVTRWVDYRKELKKPLSSQSQVDAFVKLLIKYSGGEGNTAEAIIDQSIGNKWQGIFELKQSGVTKVKKETVFEHNSRVLQEMNEMIDNPKHQQKLL